MNASSKKKLAQYERLAGTLRDRIAAGIYHRQGDDATAYAHALRYIEMQDSLEAASRDALSVQLERQHRAPCS